MRLLSFMIPDHFIIEFSYHFKLMKDKPEIHWKKLFLHFLRETKCLMDFSNFIALFFYSRHLNNGFLFSFFCFSLSFSALPFVPERKEGRQEKKSKSLLNFKLALSLIFPRGRNKKKREK